MSLANTAPLPAYSGIPRQRILLYSEYRVLLDALQTLLGQEFDVVTVYTRASFLSAIETLHPNLAVLELGNSRKESLRTLRDARERSPDLPFILLSTNPNDADQLQARLLGAKALLHATSPGEQIISSMRRVLRGEALDVTSTRNGTVSALAPARTRLTTRQIEVLKLIAKGFSAKAIANVLELSVRTAEFHRAAIMDRLDLRSTAQLTRYALHHGIE